MNEDALKRASRLLAIRPRFERELRERLASYPDEEVERAIGSLRQLGYLNDQQTARDHVASNCGKNAISATLLAARMAAAGAPETLVEEETSGIDDKANMMALLGHRYSQSKDDRAKAFRLLISRGFDSDGASGAVDSFFHSFEAVETE